MSLTKDQIQGIEATALELLAEAYEGAEILPPIDLQKIAKKLGIEIREGNFSQQEVAGAYDRIKKMIYVSSTDSQSRQKFTIAHEIGHHILHQDKANDVFLRTYTQFFGNEKPVEESQADCFAASLLMPKNLVEKIWSVVRDEAELAKIFAVSDAAAHWRLHNLGLVR